MWVSQHKQRFVGSLTRSLVQALSVATSLVSEKTSSVMTKQVTMKLVCIFTPGYPLTQVTTTSA